MKNFDDPVNDFIAAHIWKADAGLFVAGRQIWDSYEKWCRLNRFRPVRRQRFSESLHAWMNTVGGCKRTWNGRDYNYHGVGLRAV